ncbi:MAG: hypothetical protein GX442_25720 [Candidatus Riflebacteria bacterium]|nr:hypothetical protein [Candidatus Riflebacteria bacterium]
MPPGPKARSDSGFSALPAATPSATGVVPSDSIATGAGSARDSTVPALPADQTPSEAAPSGPSVAASSASEQAPPAEPAPVVTAGVPGAPQLSETGSHATPPSTTPPTTPSPAAITALEAGPLGPPVCGQVTGPGQVWRRGAPVGGVSPGGGFPLGNRDRVTVSGEGPVELTLADGPRMSFRGDGELILSPGVVALPEGEGAIEAAAPATRPLVLRLPTVRLELEGSAHLTVRVEDDESIVWVAAGKAAWCDLAASATGSLPAGHGLAFSLEGRTPVETPAGP